MIKEFINSFIYLFDTGWQFASLLDKILMVTDLVILVVASGLLIIILIKLGLEIMKRIL